MRRWPVLAAVAIAAPFALAAPGFARHEAWATAGRQDMGGQEQECDLKKVEDGLYCAKCDALLEKDGLDKEGRCVACKQKPEKCRVCVKTYFVADC